MTQQLTALRPMMETKEAPIDHKMFCVFAQEALKTMNGNRGKMSSQAGHAYLHSWWDSYDRFPHHALTYQDSGLAFKITLVVPLITDLYPLLKTYEKICGVSLVTDAARTVFKEPTTTCLGIGPLPVPLIGDDLKTLKVLI